MSQITRLRKHTRRLIRWMAANTLDLVFPAQCTGCGRVGSQLCATCRHQLDRSQPIHLARPYLKSIYAAGHFEGTWRRVIHAFKYEGQQTLAEALAARLPIPPDMGEAPLVIAVPLHPNRARWRGYNQADLLADALAARVGWRTAHAALVRRRDTRPQVGLRAAERWHNMKGAFHAEKETVAGQEVLLVDDVFTTGATLSAAAEALHQAQGTAVWAVTLACAL